MSRRKTDSPFSLFAFQDAITSVCGVIVLITLMLALQLTRAALEDSRQIENAKTARELENQIVDLRERIERTKSPSASSEFIAEAAGMSLAEIENRLAAARERYAEAKEERELAERERNELENREKESEKTVAENRALAEKIQSAKDAEETARASLRDGLNRGVLYEYPTDSSFQPWFVVLSKDEIVATSRKGSNTFSTTDSFLEWAILRSPETEYFVLISRPGGVDSFELIFEKLGNYGFQLGVDFIGERQVPEFLPQENEENDAT